MKLWTDIVPIKLVDGGKTFLKLVVFKLFKLYMITVLKTTRLH